MMVRFGDIDRDISGPNRGPVAAVIRWTDGSGWTAEFLVGILRLWNTAFSLSDICDATETATAMARCPRTDEGQLSATATKR